MTTEEDPNVLRFWRTVDALDHTKKGDYETTAKRFNVNLDEINERLEEIRIDMSISEQGC
jgi:tyrosine-protein phosphatase YwqE